MEGFQASAFSRFSWAEVGGGAHLSPCEAGKGTPLEPFQIKHSVLLQLLEDIGRPAEGNSSCFSPARGEKVFFGLLSMS